MKLHQITLALLSMLTTVVATLAMAGETDTDTQVLKESSLYKKDLLHGSYPGEQINPANGKLNWVINDLTIPGPAGMDINKQ
jgi:hypothetical protein